MAHAVALGQTGVVGHWAEDGEATMGASREEHESLDGWRILIAYWGSRKVSHGSGRIRLWRLAGNPPRREV